MNLSLRTKGILAITVLILYCALIAIFLANQRQKLSLIVHQMESTQLSQAMEERLL